MICLLFPFLAVWKGRGPSGPVYYSRGARGPALWFASLLYLPPLWRAARPRSERSVGGPVIICLLFHLPTLWRAARAGQLIIALLLNLPLLWRAGLPIICLSALFAPVMARGPSSERALRRRPNYHLPFVSFAHLKARDPSGPAYHCFAALYKS